MEIGTSMRSGRLYEFVAKGLAGMPIGSEGNAKPVYLISRMALGVEKFDLERNKAPVDDPLFKDNKWPLPAFVVKMKAGQVEPGGLISVPNEAWMHAWIYGMPETSEEELHTEVVGFFQNWIKNDPVLKTNPVQIIKHTRFLLGSVTPIDHPVVSAIIENMQKITGKTIKVTPVDVTGDNGILVKYGNTPTICFGPGGANLHAEDEYVNTEDLINLTKIYANTILDWCGK